jgi:hypothetical protein
MEESITRKRGDPGGVDIEAVDERIRNAVLSVSQALLSWKAARRTGSLKFIFGYREGGLSTTTIETSETLR